VVHLGAVTLLISRAVWTMFGKKAPTQVIKEIAKEGTASPHNYFVALGV